MLRFDLRHHGQFCLGRPERTLRAFGCAPYARVFPVPQLAAEALATRIGSFYFCLIADPKRKTSLLAVLFELQTLPGYSMRGGWLRGRALVLREEIFPDT